MITKFIRWNVAPGRHDAFAEGQERWGGLRSVPGFKGQVGGWSLHRPNLAVIVSLWEDTRAYRRFMDEDHDRLFAQTGQEGTAISNEIVVGEEIVRIGDPDASIRNILFNSEVLRYSDCTVHPNREDAFIATQENVWNKGLESAGGMVGGTFARLAPLLNRFLVATFWESEDDHARYSRDGYPALARQARPQDFLTSGRGGLVLLQRSWHVLA